MVATSRGLWISIFKYRFRNTVAADEEICLVVKKVGGAAGVWFHQHILLLPLHFL